MKKLPNKFDTFLHFGVIAIVISGIYSIYVLYNRGGAELLIIGRINQTVFGISMYVYYRKENPVMLLFMVLTLVVHIMLFVELYSWYVSQQRHLSSIFGIVIYIGVVIYFLYTALKKRM